MTGALPPRPRLFYASQSIEDPRVTNMIQVRQMVTAFANACDVTVAVKEGPGGVAWPEGVRVLRLPAPRTRYGNARFGLDVYAAFRRDGDGADYVYSRNPVFSSRCGRLAPRAAHAFECHHFIGGAAAVLPQSVLFRRSDLIVPITEALGRRIARFAPPAAPRIHVAHDAHANEVLAPSARPASGRPQVGYIGKLILSKGRELLRDLIRTTPGADFHVYTPSVGVLEPRPNLVAYEHLPHERVAERMRAMDLLLLPLVPQPNARDFSAYTSPLKLFEYLSVAGVIVGSDQPALREVLTHGENAWLVDNSVEAWRAAIEELWRDQPRRLRLSAGAARAAEGRTWDARAAALLSALEARRNNA